MPENRLAWVTPENVQRDHDTARRFVIEQGIVISNDPQYSEKARSAFTKIALALRDVLFVSSLRFVYVYDIDCQPAGIDTSHSDGYAKNHVNTNGRRISSIGISTQALDYSEDYAIMVLIHELAHVTVKGYHDHDDVFYAWMDRLLKAYNDYHGTEIENDYS